MRLSSGLHLTGEQHSRPDVDPTVPNEPERHSTALPLDTDTQPETGRVRDDEQADLENVTITEKEYQ